MIISHMAKTGVAKKNFFGNLYVLDGLIKP